MNTKDIKSRRNFLQQSSLLTAASFMMPSFLVAGTNPFKKKVRINAHLWVYASQFPPNWDCTPILDTVFSDLSHAGIDGLELMEPNLRHDDSVKNLNALIKKHQVKVSGSSYGVGFSMWDRKQHETIINDIDLIIPRLSEVGGRTFGISVGGSDHKKTEEELDAQAEILLKIRATCQANNIVANLHNHTYEVENNLHDLRGTLRRIPDFKLGPDVNWLIRAGVDPVSFINTYGNQIVYLHIRDQYESGEWTEYVGQGATDFKAIAQALHKVDFKGDVAIELAFPNDFEPENSLREDWKMSKEYIQKTFGW
ncbi:TIM barrel protein [Lutimonas sp.]|uniref:sugar phosphate isomerase/epimerase family protein n=1 Tax=Lutimonas sp. TaxID=1872403 RepID=UPI003D9B0E08